MRRGGGASVSGARARCRSSRFGPSRRPKRFPLEIESRKPGERHPTIDDTSSPAPPDGPICSRPATVLQSVPLSLRDPLLPAPTAPGRCFPGPASSSSAKLTLRCSLSPSPPAWTSWATLPTRWTAPGSRTQQLGPKYDPVDHQDPEVHAVKRLREPGRHLLLGQRHETPRHGALRDAPLLRHGERLEASDTCAPTRRTRSPPACVDPRLRHRPIAPLEFAYVSQLVEVQSRGIRHAR